MNRLTGRIGVITGVAAIALGAWSLRSMRTDPVMPAQGDGAVDGLRGAEIEGGPERWSENFAPRTSGESATGQGPTEGGSTDAASSGARRWGIGDVPMALVAEPAPELPPSDDEALSLPWRKTPLRYDLLKEFCTADFNRDDVLDDQDIVDFLDEWSRRDGPLAAMLDLDGDGWLTEADASKFFESLDEDCQPMVHVAMRAIREHQRTESGRMVVELRLVQSTVVEDGVLRFQFVEGALQDK